MDLCRRAVIEQGKQVVAPGSDGAELVTGIKPDESISLDAGQLLKGEPQQVGEQEWVLYKPRWGAFYGTNLEQMMREMEISTVVVAGCNFPNCPRTTVYEASERDFRVVLAGDAVSCLYPKGREELQGICVSVLNTKEILKR